MNSEFQIQLYSITQQWVVVETYDNELALIAELKRRRESNPTRKYRGCVVVTKVIY